MKRPSERGAGEVFVSYASPDRDHTFRIVAELETAGVDVWLDRRRIGGGMNYGAEIVRAISESKAFVLMCSAASLRSRNVKQEIQLAWRHEKPCLPLLLDDSLMASCPAQVQYWLEGRQWVEVFDAPSERWLAQVLAALSACGVTNTNGVLSIAAPVPAAERQKEEMGGWAALRAAARFTDQIWPIPSAAVPQGRRGAALRDLGAPPERAEYAHRVGARVVVAIESERDGYLTLLDEGPSGKLYCLCPSAFAPDIRLAAGRTYLPLRSSAYEAFVVTGRPGREHLVAVITNEPMNLEWMPTDPTTPARVLSEQDIISLVERLKGLGADEWIAFSTYFDVLA